jgi:nucleoside-triphosphatase
MPKAIVKNVLLTGLPGCGKTTVVRRLVKLLNSNRLAGFYTDEIREHGHRVGFTAVGLGGPAATLAHVGFHGPHRVGRYGVDLRSFEAIVEAELNRQPGNADAFVVDEIGKMECMSPVFVEAVTRILDSSVPVLATIAAKGGGFIAGVKARPDVEIVTVTAANRDELPNELASRVRSR